MPEQKNNNKVYGAYFIAIMDQFSYDNLQKCLGVDFKKEAKRLKRINKKIK